MSTTILLIDLSGIAHPLWHTTDGSSNPNECSIQTVAKVRALASGQPHVAVCCDSGLSFRRDIDPTYKAQRPETDATLQHQITLAVETLKADGFPCWAVKGFEADDLIASACFHADMANQRNADTPGFVEHVIIASSDKDLLQLVSPLTRVHRVADTKKATTVDEAVVMAEYGVTPNQLTEWLMLVGDSSDNIKGAEGIGPKTATAMLQKFGNLTDFYAELAKDPKQFKSGTVKAMTEFRPRMEQVRALVTLRTDVPLPFEEVFRERVPADVAVFDGEGLMDGSEATPEDHAVGPDQTATVVRGDAVSGTAGNKPEHAKASDISQGAGEVRRDAPNGSHPQGARQAATSAKPTTEGNPFSDMMAKPATLGDFERELEPHTLRDASLLSIEIHKSRLYSAYGTWQGVLTTILAGRELGLQTMASLRAFHIIDGKPTLSADLIRALVLKHPLCEYFRCTERTPTQAKWVTKRKGDEPISLTFTVEDGRRAWPKDQASFDKSSWGKNPADMCVARASAKLARLVYADVVFNLYAPEEFDGSN